MTAPVPPRPRSFRVYVVVGTIPTWATFTDGVTDIPSVLDAVWRQVVTQQHEYEVLDEAPADE